MSYYVMRSGTILPQFRRKRFSFSLHVIPNRCVTSKIALKQPSKFTCFKTSFFVNFTVIW